MFSHNNHVNESYKISSRFKAIHLTCKTISITSKKLRNLLSMMIQHKNPIFLACISSIDSLHKKNRNQIRHKKKKKKIQRANAYQEYLYFFIEKRKEKKQTKNSNPTYIYNPRKKKTLKDLL